ncbi:MAG: sulfotransferase [Pseudomonadota bacterium]
MQQNAKQDMQALYKSAMADQSAGDFDMAVKKYAAIVEAFPKVPEPYFQVGRLEMEKRRYVNAAAHFEKALSLKPKEPALWMNYARALRLANEKPLIDSALRNLKNVSLPQDTKNKVNQLLTHRAPPTVASRGSANIEDLQKSISFLEKREFAKSAENTKAIIKKHKNSAVAYNLLGCAQIELRQYNEAEQSFKNALKISPNYLEALSNIGRIQIDMGHARKGLEYTEKVRMINPDHLQGIIQTALFLNYNDEPQTAIRLLKTVMDKKSTDNPDAMITMSELLSRSSEHDEAIEYAEALFKTNKSVKSYLNIGRAYDQAEKIEKAIKVLEAGIKKYPKEGMLYNRLGVAYQYKGDFEQGRTYLLKAIEIAPDRGSFYTAYLQSIKIDAEDPVFEMMLNQWDRKDLPDPSREAFGYAIASGYEKSKDYKKVFPYLNTATAIERRRYPYQISTRRNYQDQVKQFYESYDPKLFAGDGVEDFKPIFITGLPRSGTTITERIISAHSTVIAGGEDGQSRAFINKLKEVPGNEMETYAGLRSSVVNRIGEVTKEHFQGRFPDASIVTDKAIGNYTDIGLIKAALPNAKFVVLRRDPRDNLLSIYKNRFTQGTHLYANSLEHVAQYYHTYLDFLDMWREKAPDAFYELNYEKLTENPEEETRKLIAYCDLEWEDACLSFHEKESTVRTLSVYQARQPIYKSSVALWENYKEELKPMLDILAQRDE